LPVLGERLAVANLVRDRGVERDPQEDEPGIGIVGFACRPLRPAQRAMRAQRQRFGKRSPNLPLPGFQLPIAVDGLPPYFRFRHYNLIANGH